MQAFEPRRRPSNRSEQGFILAMVLWLLVAIAVAVGLLMLWTRERVLEATAAQAELDARLGVISTRETLLYLAATIPATQAGLPTTPISPAELSTRRLDEFGGFDRSPRGGEIRLDGTVYQGFEDLRFAIQDEAGLIPVAFPSASPVGVMLSAVGLPRSQRDALFDQLADYVDEDDVARLNGAEARQYERAGRLPPPGRPLLSPRELESVLGWGELAPETLAQLQEWSTTSYTGALNLNTAPIGLLESMADCGTICRDRLSRRESALFASGREFEADTASRLPGDRDVDFRTTPSNALRLTFWGPAGRAWRIHVRLTPLADQAAPWTVDAVYRTSRPSTNDVPRTIQSPLFANAPVDGP